MNIEKTTCSSWKTIMDIYQVGFNYQAKQMGTHELNTSFKSRKEALDFLSFRQSNYQI